jgi:hypothetical protein
MTPEQEVRDYNRKKLAKKGAKTIAAQAVKIGGGVVGGINPISTLTNVSALRSTSRHIDAIEELIDDTVKERRRSSNSELQHSYAAELLETMRYVVAQKRSKKKRYKQNLVPIMSLFVGIYSGAHYLKKKTWDHSQGDERRKHAKRLWRYANGRQPDTQNPDHKKWETRLARLVVAELVGAERLSWVLKTPAGHHTVIYDKLAKT